MESRQDQHLKALSEQTGHSEAELIRQAIDRHLIQPLPQAILRTELRGNEPEL